MTETVRLPMIPEPILTPEERKQLSALYADPAFWEWYVQQPEPTDAELAALSSISSSH